MTWIQWQVKKHRENLQTRIKEQDAETIAAFEAQKENIAKIANTEWFKYMRWYWLQKEMEAVNDLWENIDADDVKSIAEAKAKYKLAKEFNSYLNVRLK